MADDTAYEFVRSVVAPIDPDPDEADMCEIVERLAAMLLPIWGVEGMRRLLDLSWLDNLDPDLLG
mgnify:CR=1 FL=1